MTITRPFLSLVLMCGLAAPSFAAGASQSDLINRPVPCTSDEFVPVAVAPDCASGRPFGG